MKLLCSIVLACLVYLPLEGTDSTFIKVHFLYGSKPAKGFKKSENKWFGGLHGGHVYIEVDSVFYSFYPKGKFHVFAHRWNRHSVWAKDDLKEFGAEDTPQMKTCAIVIPVDSTQKADLLSTLEKYHEFPPYDYAFFGHRCASAAYEALSRAGIYRSYSGFRNIMLHFYPKPLRRKLLKQAQKKGYIVEKKEGRKGRKWESDRKTLRI